MKAQLYRGFKGAGCALSVVLLLGCLNNVRNATAGSEPNPTVDVVTTTPQPAAVEAATSVPVPEDLQNLSPDLFEVVKLLHAGASEEVILAFIHSSETLASPTADEVVYLMDLGASDTVVTALLGKGPKTDAAQTAQTSQPELPQAPAPAPEPPAVAPAPEVAAHPPIEVAPPAQEVHVSYFYNSLAPYGNWIHVADYGLCWQPTVVAVNRNWRPYHDRGRWVYTTHGWYWQSDYSWGWAPFHYGRWHHDLRVGWVWVPDTTWGPAWVSWRYSTDYYGWAPLPPVARYSTGVGFYYHSTRVGVGFDFGLAYHHYTFVPVSRFCDRYPYRYALHHSRSRVIYQHTTVINNYIIGNNNTIINEGIGRQRVAAATNTDIRPATVRQLPFSGLKREVFDRESNTVHVHRPQTAATKTSFLGAAQRQPSTASQQAAPASAARSEPTVKTFSASRPPSAPVTVLGALPSTPTTHAGDRASKTSGFRQPAQQSAATPAQSETASQTRAPTLFSAPKTTPSAQPPTATQSGLFSRPSGGAFSTTPSHTGTARQPQTPSVQQPASSPQPNSGLTGFSRSSTQVAPTQAAPSRTWPSVATPAAPSPSTAAPARPSATTRLTPAPQAPAAPQFQPRPAVTPPAASARPQPNSFLRPTAPSSPSPAPQLGRPSPAPRQSAPAAAPRSIAPIQTRPSAPAAVQSRESRTEQPSRSSAPSSGLRPRR